MEGIPYMRPTAAGITSKQLTASGEDISILCAGAVWLSEVAILFLE
jgi:hypothetical protein